MRLDMRQPAIGTPTIIASSRACEHTGVRRLRQGTLTPGSLLVVMAPHTVCGPDGRHQCGVLSQGRSHNKTCIKPCQECSGVNL